MRASVVRKCLKANLLPHVGINLHLRRALTLRTCLRILIKHVISNFVVRFSYLNVVTGSCFCDNDKKREESLIGG